MFLMKPYYNHFKTLHGDNYETGKIYKSVDKNWPEMALVLFIGYYVQPFIFSLRGELSVPSLRRNKKLARVSLSLEFIIFMFIAIMGYYVFGDKFTPELFIIKTPLHGKEHFIEKFQIFILFIFFLASAFGLAIYSSTMRDFIGEFIELKTTKIGYTIASLIPFAIICIIGMFFPYLITLLDFFTYTVYNFNGYILPFMMAVAVHKRYIKQGN